MTRRAARNWLWLGSMFVLPLPFFLMLTGVVPLVRLAMFGAIHLYLAVSEGFGGAIALVVGLLILQVIAYAGLLWLLAHLLAGVLVRFAPRRVAFLTAMLLGISVWMAMVFEPYRLPFRAESTRGNLLAIFE